MSRKKKRRKQQTEQQPTTSWTCPVCGEVEPEGTACSTCGSQQVQLPVAYASDELQTLVRLRGRLPGPVKQRPHYGFELLLPHGERLQVTVEPETQQLGCDGELSGEVELLGQVQVVFHEPEGGLRDAPQRSFTARAELLAAGPDATELLDTAIERAQPTSATTDGGTSAPPGQDAELTDRLTLRREPGAMELTWSPEAGALLSIRAYPTLGALFYLPMLLQAGEQFFALKVFAVVVALLGLYPWLLLLNRRIIHWDGKRLSLRFAPLPWRGWSAAGAEVVRLVKDQRDRPQEWLENEHPDTLLAELADGTTQELLIHASSSQVYEAHELLQAELHLHGDRPAPPALQRKQRRRLLLGLGKLALLLGVLFVGNRSLCPGSSLVLQGGAIHYALERVNRCNEVRKVLGDNITWAIWPHWSHRGCGTESGHLTFAVRGERARGILSMRYDGMGCAEASFKRLYVHSGEVHINALYCLVDEHYSPWPELGRW